MNIQIFGTNKGFDTKKAERFFKERGIRFQFVDLNDKGISRGELLSVLKVVPLADIIDEKSKDKTNLALLEYLTEDMKIEKLLECQSLIKTPIVRNGKEATVGYHPEIWKNWQ
jgi:arsenate reductase (glutaredoxin)